jgi:hypothetical protein
MWGLLSHFRDEINFSSKKNCFEGGKSNLCCMRQLRRKIHNARILQDSNMMKTIPGVNINELMHKKEEKRA